MNQSNYLLEASGISLSYRKKLQHQAVLEGFSLQLRAGEVLAILGASGSGKSTLLQVLAGLKRPNQGHVLLRGERLDKPHSCLGFMFQDACLLPWLNLEKNVAFGLGLKQHKQLSKIERKQRVQTALAEVGLEHAAKSYPHELSGGMAQRGSLARSFVCQPEILLLDEPFSALDAVTRAEMQQLLLMVTKKHHTAVVIVTHDIKEALTLADRILLLGGKPASLQQSWLLNGQQALEQIQQEIITQLGGVAS